LIYFKKGGKEKNKDQLDSFKGSELKKIDEAPPLVVSTTSKEILELYNADNKDDSTKNHAKIDSDINETNAIENTIFQDLEGNAISLGETSKTQDENEVISNSQEIVNKLPKIIEPINENDNLNAPKQNSDLNFLNRADSDQSIASTITNSSQITSNRLKQKEVEEEEELPEWLVQDVHVIVSTNSVLNKPGRVRYIGPTKFAPGTWIGVELEQAFGKNDGSLKGKSYFKCDENKGVFVRVDKLTLVSKQN
jgi:hypothetical protein